MPRSPQNAPAEISGSVKKKLRAYAKEHGCAEKDVIDKAVLAWIDEIGSQTLDEARYLSVHAWQRSEDLKSTCGELRNKVEQFERLLPRIEEAMWRTEHTALRVSALMCGIEVLSPTEFERSQAALCALLDHPLCAEDAEILAVALRDRADAEERLCALRCKLLWSTIKTGSITSRSTHANAGGNGHGPSNVVQRPAAEERD